MVALIRPECPNPAALAGDSNSAPTYSDPINKDALKRSTFGKCMYCESIIGHASYPEVEHIKPKSIYPELEFVWENLGYSCPVCNRKKRSKYDESLPFINPYEEDPEEEFMFIDYIIWPKNKSNRAKFTINSIKLNREVLIDRRKDKLDDVRKMINAAKNSIVKSLKEQILLEVIEKSEKDKEYSVAVKNLLVAEGILK